MIKRIFKTLGVLTFFGTSLVSLYLVNLFYMKPASIDHYLAKEVITDLLDSPEAMTYMGVFDGLAWLTNHNSRLSIPQDSDIEDGIKHTEKIIKTLYKYNDSNLSDIQKNTKKIAIFDYENQLKELQYFPYLDYPLNQIGGIHLNTVEFMNSVHPIRTKSEAKAFIKRTDLIKEVYEGTLNHLKKSLLLTLLHDLKF